MAKMTLDQLVAQLQLAFGPELVAVVLYGSASRGEHHAGRSDQNVLVVVERITMETLAREAGAAAAWAEAGHPPPVTMTKSEWLGSADIFPIEYADVLESHRVLHGALPVSGLRVDPRDLRLQLEHEAIGKLFRLRRGILTAGSDAKKQLALLGDSVRSFLVLFRALLRAHGDAPPKDAEGTITEAAARAGILAAPFVKAWRHARGTEPIPAAEASAVLDAYLAGATQLAQHIDRLGAP